MHDRSRTTLAVLAFLAAARPLAAQIPLGSEFRVDTRGWVVPGFSPDTSAMTMAPDGTFVVTWTEGPLPGGYNVVARRFDASGVGQGADFIVNTFTTGHQYNPAIGSDDAGNFVVVWTSDGQDGHLQGVFGQRFDSSGAQRGDEFQVNTTTFSRQRRASVAVAPGGGFVVVWDSSDNAAEGIFGQRYDASGSPAGAEFQVNTYTTNQQYVPTVDVDGLGNFVVVWTTFFPPPRAFGQRFSAAGAHQGGEFEVNSSTVVVVRPRVARSRDGSFVVAWSGVFARRFDPSGAPLGADFVVNAYTTGAQQYPEVDADVDGDFVVAWTSDGQDGNAAGVFGRRFDATAAGGPEFRANTYTTGNQFGATLATDPAGNFVVAWLSYQNGVRGIFAQRYAGGLSAAALVVDGSAGPTSDGNGVLEPGEVVAIAPSWLNANFTAQTFTGMASNFTGPGAPGDPTYTIADATANYGTVASGSTASCTTTTDCYVLGTTVPSTRPAQHWDATFQETISPANLGAAKRWTLHIGDSFADVSRASGFYRFVETLLHHSITGGCTATQYCPSSSTTREQMAVFVLVAKERTGYVPPDCTTPMFNDVPASSPFCRWIEELARRGVVAGCGGGNYCPSSPVSREQMAVFVLATREPGVIPPACGAPRFNDVPASSPFCPWIEELARRGVVTGCGGGNYCPTAPVTREQMAVFISVTFGLQLYGP